MTPPSSSPSSSSQCLCIHTLFIIEGRGLFGGKFDGYDLDGAEFGGGIEVAREASASTSREVSGKDLSGGTNVSLLQANVELTSPTTPAAD